MIRHLCGHDRTGQEPGTPMPLSSTQKNRETFLKAQGNSDVWDSWSPGSERWPAESCKRWAAQSAQSLDSSGS